MTRTPPVRSRAGRVRAAALAAVGVLGVLLAGCTPAPPIAAPPASPAHPATSAPAPAASGAAPEATLRPRPGASLVDVPYGDGAEAAQRLDVHFPSGGGPWPVVLFVHGGSWLIGDKAMPAGTGYGALRETLLARGYAVVSVNYRPSSRARFPAQLHDVAGAIRFVRAHAGELGVDADRFALAGESAGAHLAMLAALTADDPAWAGPVGPAGVSTTVWAVASIYGVADLSRLGSDLAAGCGVAVGGDGIVAALLGADPTGAGREAALAASPVTHVGARRVPMVLVHGTRDCVVPPDQSRRMAAALRTAGTPVRLELVDADHLDAALWSPAVLTGVVVPFLADALN